MSEFWTVPTEDASDDTCNGKSRKHSTSVDITGMLLRLPQTYKLRQQAAIDKLQ